MRYNGFKTTENRMLIRRGFFFLIYPSQRLCSHALPLSNPLAQGLFFMRLNSLSYQKKRGTRRRWKDIEREKKKQFRDSHSFVCGKFYFFHFTFPNLPCPSSSIAFPCVCRQNAREEESQQQWLCQHNNKGTTCNVHPLPSGPDVKPTRLTNTWRVLLL